MNTPDRSLLGFPPEAFARRRAAVLDRLEGGAMLLPAAPQRYRSRDTEYRYRPDSELFYLTGVTEPGAVALLRDVDDGPPFVLFVRERDEEAERWSGPRTGPDEAADAFDADEAHPRHELEERLPELLAPVPSVHFRLGSDERVEDLVRDALRTARRRGTRKGTHPRRVVDPGEILDDLRLVKDSAEIERIRRAAAWTADAFREALGCVAPGAGEWEIEAALESGFRRRGARGPAFPTIVGSGPNACVLHYGRNADRLESEHLVLVDGGAEVDLYPGDVTRTAPVSGTFAPEQRAAYEVVEEARKTAVEAVCPGATTEDVHRAALDVLVEGMIALGLLEGEPERLIEEEEHKAYFPHQTSHWLGLDVHDPGDYAHRGRPRRLEPGMALTVEPGLYVPPDAEGGAARRFGGIGIRIEDDVLVTEDGRENLTAALPTDPDEIADLVAGGEA